MKHLYFFVVLILLINIPYTFQLDIGKLLSGTGPLLKKYKCFSPCLFESANNLKCDGKGPINTICLNIDKIKVETMPCAIKCGINNNDANSIIKILGNICNKFN